MKIFNINSYYLSSTVHRELERVLEHKGYVLRTYTPLEMDYKIRDEIQFAIPEHVEVSKCFNKFDRIIFHVKQSKVINDFTKKNLFKGYDILHAHSLFSNGYIAFKIKQKFNIPYIVTIRDTDLNIFFKKMIHLRGLGLSILKNATKVIFLSTTYKRHCIDKYVPTEYKNSIECKSLVIPNGIDKFWLDNISKPKNGNKEIIKLIYVGNIVKRKNLLRVLQACKLIESQGKKIEFVIVGKIIDNKIASKLNSSSIVQLVNRVNKEELISLYGNSDIFIMPSITESFGLVYPEALSQGLPVIYSKGQGFDGYFEEGEVGYSVDSLNINDIKNKILKIHENYPEISERCITKVNEFSWDVIVNKYCKVFDEILFENNNKY